MNRSFRWQIVSAFWSMITLHYTLVILQVELRLEDNLDYMKVIRKMKRTRDDVIFEQI